MSLDTMRTATLYPEVKPPGKPAPPPGPVTTRRTYRGRRDGEDTIVEVTRVDARGSQTSALDPRTALRFHADRFEWASGVACRKQLALAILADATGREAFALAYYEDFDREVIRDLPWASWELAAADVHAWIVSRCIRDIMRK
jgi:hypothetical protein